MVNVANKSMNDIKEILELIICVLGVVIPLVVLIIEHFDKKRTKLAEQVIAYYCLQEEAVKWIQELAPNEKKVKEQLRKRAENHEENNRRIYPTIAVKEAEKYL